MDLMIALLLAQDGLTNGAIYALLAVATVLVFAVTRILFVPQGDFVSYGALTLASFQVGKVPGTAWLLAVLGVVTALVEISAALRVRRGNKLPRIVLERLVVPIALAGLAVWIAPRQAPLLVQVALTVALIMPIGAMTYRLAFEPLANASVLVLLIVAVAVHFVLQGLALAFFGAEGVRTPPFSEARFALGALIVSGQSLAVIGTTIVLIAALYTFFARTVFGKALRATAINRVGARIVGISPTLSGRLALTLAAGIGAMSGVLIGPIATMYYDSGFFVGLKGFVGAVAGGLVSYPLAALGAIFVGLLESYASFWSSPLKEVIVFSSLIPILLWLSLRAHAVDEPEDDV